MRFLSRPLIVVILVSALAGGQELSGYHEDEQLNIGYQSLEVDHTPKPTQRSGLIRSGLTASAAEVPSAEERMPASGEPDPRIDPSPSLTIGVHMDLTWDTDPERRHRALRSAEHVLGSELSKHSLLWHLIEPTRGNRDWSVVDAVVDGSIAAGMDVLFDVRGSPAWASRASPKSDPDAYLFVPSQPTDQRVWLDHWADFLEEAASRYGDRVRYWTLWGEPNQHFNFKPRPDLELYKRMYVAGYAAIKDAAPNALVAPGSLTALSAQYPGDIEGFTFLTELFASNLPMDAIAISPYTAHSPDEHVVWENNFDDIGRLPDLMRRYGVAVPVWVLEWGWSESEVGEAQQAEYIGRSLEILTDRYPFVTIACVFMDADRPGLFDYGLLTQDFAPKLAAAAFARFTSVHSR